MRPDPPVFGRGRRPLADVANIILWGIPNHP
jgi:hypothetical protein